MVASPSSVRSSSPCSWLLVARPVSQAVAPMAQAATASDSASRRTSRLGGFTSLPQGRLRRIAGRQVVGHLVADAVDREEIARVRRLLLDLAPQIHHMDVNGAIER